MNRFWLLAFLFLIGFLFIATPAMAGMNANSIDVYNAPVLCANENTLLSAGANGPMGQVGTVPFVTSPAPPNSGNYCMGPFTSTQYLTWSSAEMLAMSNQTAGFIEFNGYITSFSGTNVGFALVDSTWGNIYVQVTGANAVQLAVGGGNVPASGVTIALNTWVNYVFSWQANGHYQLTVNGVQGFDNTGFSGLHTVTAGTWGYLIPFTCCTWNGYITQMRYGLGTSGFPTTDTFSCATFTNTPTPSNSPVDSPTATPTQTPNWTATATPSASPTSTTTPTNGPTPTFQITPAGKSNVAQHPPKGWVAAGILLGAGDPYIRQQADAFNGQGFVPAGYSELDMDSGWASSTRTAGANLIQPSTGFPDMPGLISYCKGTDSFSIVGLYTTDAAVQCASYSVGSAGKEIQDMGTMIGYGANQIKVDSCGGMVGSDQYSYTLFSNGIAATGQPVQFYLCQSANTPHNAYVYGPSIGHMWNIDSDINDNWDSCVQRFQESAALYTYSGPGGWNFPGELMMGVGNDGRGIAGLSLGDQTFTQYEAQMKEWCALPAPLIVEAIITDGAGNYMNSTLQSIIKNSEALAINNNWGGVSLQLISDDGMGGKVYARPLSGTAQWVVLMSNTRTAGTTGTVIFNNLPSSPMWVASPSGSATVRDAWSHVNIGSASVSYSNSLSGTSAELFTLQFPLPSPTPTATITATPTATPTWTPTATPTWSCILTYTPSVTLTMLGTQTPFPSYTSTPVFTATPSLTVLGSATPFPTSTPFCYYCIPPTATVTPIPWWNQYNP